MKHLKQEFDKLTFKEALVFAIAALSLIAAFVLLFLGMLIPPKGEIHDSVLTGFGIVLLFVGSLLGVSMHYSNELAKLKDQAFAMIREAANAEEWRIKAKEGDGTMTGTIVADRIVARHPSVSAETALYNNKSEPEEGVPV